MNLYSLAKMIDHSLLHPTMTDEQLRSECKVAAAYDVASVCIKPYAIEIARQVLNGTDVLVGTVIGFPHGNSSIDIKIAEATDACKRGAVEIDFVVNIGKVLGQDWDYLSREVELINKAVVENGAIIKVIFENDYYNDDFFKIKLCEISSRHNVAFVKTSTGYGFVKHPGGFYTYKGATDHDLKLMRKHSAPHVQVKAAGGIRTLDDLLRVRELGVARVGATATAAILEEAKTRKL